MTNSSQLTLCGQPAAANARSKPQRDCQRTKCYARADPALHHIPIDFIFKENFPTNTSLEQPEPSKWLSTERSDLSYLWVLQQQHVQRQEIQSSGSQVFHQVHGTGWQQTVSQPWTCCDVKGCNTMTMWLLNPTIHDNGYSNHPQIGKSHSHPLPARSKTVKNLVI